jgi:hypothetical protein
MTAPSPQKLFGPVAAITALVLLFPAASFATTVNYWGYNNMTKSNPPSGTCSSERAGFACSGWNYWDRSQIAYNSGDAVIFWGMENCAGCALRGYTALSPGVGTFIRTQWNQDNPDFPVNPYNRAVCVFADGSRNTYAYVQCRAIIF